MVSRPGMHEKGKGFGKAPVDTLGKVLNAFTVSPFPSNYPTRLKNMQERLFQKNIGLKWTEMHHAVTYPFVRGNQVKTGITMVPYGIEIRKTPPNGPAVKWNMKIDGNDVLITKTVGKVGKTRRFSEEHPSVRNMTAQIKFIQLLNQIGRSGK